MLIVTAKLSRKKIALFLAAALILSAGLIFLLAPSKNTSQESSKPISLVTNEDRLSFLAACGLEALPDPITTLDLQLPSPLDERYSAYNQLQLPQGFDLSQYCGCQLTRYTYAITDHPDAKSGVQANLYLFEDTLVAADLFCAGENGFIAPLFSE